MKSVLYLGPEERQLWGKDKNGWRPLTEAPKGHVCVVTDLAEESISDIKMPRLFGRDRASYEARQLANRYPDTPYRAVLKSKVGGIMQRFAPNHCILLGIDAAQRLNAELDSTPNPIMGVWPVSMLMVQLGQSQFLPRDLFIVLPSGNNLRIVFLKDRTPILTRLTPTPNKVAAQIDEIVRTLRYLENMRIVQRQDDFHSVLLLGDPSGFVSALAPFKMKLVAPPRTMTRKRPSDWHFPLFDLALKSPPGQVAPMNRRIDYLARHTRRAAIATAVLILAGAFGVIGSNLPLIFDTLRDIREADATAHKLNIMIAEHEQQITKFGIAPDLLRRSMNLYEEEIKTAPSIENQLNLVSEALSGDSNLRLKRLGWKILGVGATPCQADEHAAPSAATPEPAEQATSEAEATTPARKVEIVMELAIPEHYGPRNKAQALQGVSARLAKIQGIHFLRDPAKDKDRTSLRGGATAQGDKDPNWCVTLPGAPVVPAPLPDAQSSGVVQKIGGAGT